MSAYPALIAELIRRGWSDGDLAGALGGNLLRAMAAAEKVAATMQEQVPPSLAVPQEVPAATAAETGAAHGR